MADKCIKHNVVEAEDTSVFENFGHGSICKNAIEDSQTVQKLLNDPTASEEYKNRKTREALATEFQTFVSSNPKQEQIVEYLDGLIHKIKDK